MRKNKTNSAWADTWSRYGALRASSPRAGRDLF